MISGIKYEKRARVIISKNLRKVAVRPGCIVSMSDFSGPCYKVRIDIYNDKD